MKTLKTRTLLRYSLPLLLSPAIAIAASASQQLSVTLKNNTAHTVTYRDTDITNKPRGTAERVQVSKVNVKPGQSTTVTITFNNLSGIMGSVNFTTDSNVDALSCQFMDFPQYYYGGNTSFSSTSPTIKAPKIQRIPNAEVKPRAIEWSKLIYPII